MNSTRFLVVFAILLILGVQAQAAKRCEVVHLKKQTLDITRLVRPPQFRFVRSQFVLVNPEQYRNRHGVSAVEKVVREKITRRVREFTDREVAEFVALYLVRTNSIVAEVAKVQKEIQLGNIFVVGHELEPLVARWQKIVETESEAGLLDKGHLKLLEEIDNLVDFQPSQPQKKATTDPYVEFLLKAADTGAAIDPFRPGTPRLQEQVRGSLMKAFEPIIRHYRLTRLHIDDLIRRRQVRITVTRSTNLRAVVEPGEIFIGDWSLEWYLRDLATKMRSHGGRRLESEGEPQKALDGPKSRMISPIYEKK